MTHLRSTDNTDLDKLEQSRASLIRLTEGISDEVLEHRSFPHPVFGLMDLKQWIDFVGVHEKRHLAQIEDIKQAVLAKQPD